MKRRKFIQQGAAATAALSLSTVSCTPCTDAEFLILGGGLSGLYLAHLLEEAGRDYVLLEGSNRLGGRLFSHPDLKRDVGGRGIGDKYTEVMKIVDKLNVDVIDITDMVGGPSAVYKDGVLHASWEDAPSNPSRLEFSKLRSAIQPSKLDEWYQRPDLDVPYSQFLKELGHTEEELALINISSNYNDVFETSALNSFHSRAFRMFNGTKRLFNFKGGSKAFTDKIIATLSGPLHTEKMVNSISAKGDCTIVKCEDGSQYCGKKAISTFPFSTLRDVDIDMPLNANQKKAINELPYTLITQIHVQADELFWEEDGIPLSMWTDTPLERLMSVNADKSKGELVCWVNGKGTAFFDDMSDSEIGEYAIKKLNEIRPSTEGKISYVGTHNWGKYRYNKGAYCEFGVGHAALFEDMIKPAGNLHFAGEHTAKRDRGIEAAAASARRVFDELMG